VSQLATPGILNKHGLDNSLKRNRDLRSPHFVRNGSRSSGKDDKKLRNTSDSERRASDSRSLCRTQNVQDVFTPMWSWYYGESGPPASWINIPVGDKKSRRDSSGSSIDLTEALDPEWYFRDRESGGILKSPGLRKVGFGKQKVAFIDVLGTESRRL